MDQVQHQLLDARDGRKRFGRDLGNSQNGKSQNGESHDPAQQERTRPFGLHKDGSLHKHALPAIIVFSSVVISSVVI
jgi:hypothetical protein